MADAHHKKSCWARFCGHLLHILGWTAEGGPIPERKAIVLGVPHTSIWDFAISYLFYTAFDAQKPRVMVKKQFFVWPLGGLMRSLGAIPVDRSNATSLVMSLITEMESDEEFILAIAPEGTRKPVKRWKTGFHTIARQTGVPVYLGYFDWGRKRVGVGRKFGLTDDAKGDMARIQEAYEEMHLTGKHPGGYITH